MIEDWGGCVAGKLACTSRDMCEDWIEVERARAGRMETDAMYDEASTEG